MVKTAMGIKGKKKKDVPVAEVLETRETCHDGQAGGQGREHMEVA